MPYPYTIENGAGEAITFLGRTPDDEHGERLLVENRVSPGQGPPMHVHHLQEEALTVRQGRIGYERAGEPPRYAGVGETVVFRAGEGHRFWNAGEEELRCEGYVRPPHNVEFFLGALYDSARRGGRGRPGLLDVAFLTRRYRGEYGVLVGPAVVRRVVFPVMVALGTVLGRYGRYAVAPEPLGRGGRAS